MTKRWIAVILETFWANGDNIVKLRATQGGKDR